MISRPSSEVQALLEELLDDPPGYRQDEAGPLRMLWDVMGGSR